MPFAFALLLVSLALVILVVGLVVWGLRRRKQRTDVVLEEREEHEVATVTYRVPRGQDPAAVLAVLFQEHYAAAEDPEFPTDIVITLPGRAGDGTEPQERERVRRLIAERAPLNMEGDPSGVRVVRFLDERHPQV